MDPYWKDTGVLNLVKKTWLREFGAGYGYGYGYGYEIP